MDIMKYWLTHVQNANNSVGGYLISFGVVNTAIPKSTYLIKLVYVCGVLLAQFLAHSEHVHVVRLLAIFECHGGVVCSPSLEGQTGHGRGL